jgi:hypothetical protein
MGIHMENTQSDLPSDPSPAQEAELQAELASLLGPDAEIDLDDGDASDEDDSDEADLDSDDN